jgi:DNA helicase-2/ATP-dependent DNA helicase PcrA
MSNLNQKQKEAVEYNDGHLLIVAGAGTGKTTVITEKIAYLITTKGVSPEHILALTFTDKASREMQDRVDSLLGSSFNDVQISTFHSFCQKILEEYGLEIGISNRFKLLSTTDTWILVREHLDAFDLNYYKPLGDPSRYIYELIAHFNKCKDELVSAEDYLNFAQEESKKDGESVVEESGRLYELAKAYFVYNQLLLNSNYLDFGDLIFYTIKLLGTRPGLRKKIQNRFQYILVDEFQDVNWAQYKLIELLVGENSRLTVVGDDDQSIYAFRGASVSNILRFKDDFPSANSIVLIENFRSHQSILDTAYELIQKNNPDRLETKLSINKRLVSSNNENTANQVFYFHASNAEDEIDYIVNKIIEIKNTSSDIQWKDFAILVRAHNHGELIGNVLEKQHIPFDFLSSAGLLKQSIVLDCISFFKSITEINDSVALYRLLNIPCFDIDVYDLQKIIFLRKRKVLRISKLLSVHMNVGCLKKVWRKHKE